MAIDAVSIIRDGYDTAIASIGDFTSDLSTAQVAGATALGGVALGAGVVGIISAIKRRKPTRKKVKKKTKRGRKRDRAFISKQKHERAYIKRKRKAGKKITRKRYKTRRSKSKKRVGKIYYTKKGQPYKILASGKARFIKKTKGGRR